MQIMHKHSALNRLDSMHIPRFLQAAGKESRAESVFFLCTHQWLPNPAFPKNRQCFFPVTLDLTCFHDYTSYQKPIA